MKADAQLFMSAASWWELAINKALGRLRIDLRARLAQAISEDLMLLTRDSHLKAYGSHVLCV
jgi:PIN domain nuclease of toxin-antitoxin system